MRNLILFILLSCCVNLNAQEIGNATSLAEIDFLKEDPSIILSIGLIQNVQTDWGKLGLRGKVMRMIEEQYDKDKKTRLSFIMCDFSEDGRIQYVGIDSLAHRTFVYSKKGQLEEELSFHRQVDKPSVKEVIHKYEYKKGKLKDAFYDNNIVTYYGNGKYNLFYNTNGQIIKLDNLQEYTSTIYGYNSRGQLIEKEIKKSTGSNPSEFFYVNTLVEYNDKNDIERRFLKYISANQTDTSFLVNTYQYKYDLNDNWIECSYLGGGKVVSTHRRIYYHDGSYSGDSLSEEDSKRVYSQSEVDILPMHVERKESIFEYLMKNVHPAKVMDRVGQGNIKLTMIISDKGEISDIKIQKEPDFKYSDEILPVIPKRCIPARKNGKDVNSSLEFFVRFKRTL